MDTLTWYIPMVTPFLWWPVAVLGAWNIYRRRSISMSVGLITLGSTLLATVGTLHVLFGYSAKLDSQGKIVSEVPGFLSLSTQILWGGLGVLCVVGGLVLLLWRGNDAGRDA